MTIDTVDTQDPAGVLDSRASGWFERLRRSGPLALVISFASLPMISAFRESLNALDEALLLVYPEQILAGDVPNKDFFTSYGSGGLALLAVVYAAVGPSVVAERAVGLLYHVAIATGVFAMTRRVGRLPAATAGIIAALLLVPLGLGAYVWLGAIALVIWSLVLLDGSGSSRAALLAGVVGALAMSWRPETVVIVVFSALPHVWRNPWWRHWGLGMAIGSTPLAVHAALSDGRLLANIAARVGVNGNMRLSLSDLDVILGLLTTLGAAAYLGWSAYRNPTPRLVSWAAVSILALPQMLQRMDVVHVLTVACLVLPLAAALYLSQHDLSAELAHRFGPTAARRIALVGAGVLLGTLTLQSIASATGPRYFVTHESRTLPVLHEEEKRAMEQLLSRVDALVPAGSKVFLGARDMSVPTLNDLRLYHLLPKHDAFAYNLELPPPRRRGSLLSEDLPNADALILVNVPTDWGRDMVPFVPRGDDEANDIVAEQFCLADNVHAYQILLRCGFSG